MASRLALAREPFNAVKLPVAAAALIRPGGSTMPP